MDRDNYIVKLTAVEHRAESNTRRIDKLEKQTEALTSIATSVELLVAEQKHQTEAMLDIKKDVNTLDAKVDAIEGKSGKRWDAIVEKVILIVVGAVAGFLLNLIGL